MRTKGKLAREVAIVGAGMSKFGMFQNRDSKDFFLEAYKEMLSSVDKGVDPKDIEALWMGNFTNDFFVHQGHWGPIISDLIGHTPKPATRTEGACASSTLSLRDAAFSIASGFYDIVLVGGVEQMSKRTTGEITEGLTMAGLPYEWKVGLPYPGYFAILAMSYFGKYGGTHEHLENITIKSHNNAALNPKAQFNLSIRDIMNSKIERAKQKGKPMPEWKDEKEALNDPSFNPVVSWPLCLYDCCPVSDGAACMLLVAGEIAKNFTDNPLYVIGMGQGSGRSLNAIADPTSMEATCNAAKEAYEMSGLQPSDIQFSEVHDCFSPAELIHMEDLGFSKRGQAYKDVEAGLTRLDGPMPINTSGGLKCKGHPVGATGIAQLYEVWKQLRGEAGARAIPNKNLRIGAGMNLGGSGGTSTFTILERR